ncbi:MAG TPA: cyclic nucleotide-gated ion channel [Stellaceae bacterium]|nr:cyclic nucleotide-gated ion channel [Stellaceae bacterium]
MVREQRSDYNGLMDRRQRLYRLLQPGSPEAGGFVWRVVHHLMVATGIGVMLALTVDEWRALYGDLLSDAFDLVAAFFVIDFVLRLYAAPGAPGGEHRGAWRSRLSWLTSLGGMFDLAAAFPGVIALPDTRDATLIGFIWVFKYVRYSPGLSILERVVTRARHALLSVLLGLVIVLLAAASLAYLLERSTDPAFSSIPAALWWAIVTLTTTGYGDVVPHTVGGRMLAGIVMVCGIMVFALLAGILATGYAEEMRRSEFLRTWEMVAKVPFFHNLGATLIAEVARLLRVRDYPASAVIIRRGEPGDCMYFLADGEVEIELAPQPLRLEAGAFFGELALLTGAPRNATIIATRACTLLTLDIVDFFELLGRQPELARVIHEEASLRLGPGAPVHAALKAMIARDNAPTS